MKCWRLNFLGLSVWGLVAAGYRKFALEDQAHLSISNVRLYTPNENMLNANADLNLDLFVKRPGH